MDNKQMYFPKALLFITIFLAILLFIPDVIMYKIVKIGPVTESAAILFFPFVYSLVDSITEVYGRKISLFIISSCYIVGLFFSMLLMGAVHLPSPVGWAHQSSFTFVFSQGPWVMLVGIISVGLSMYVNIKLIAAWKKKLRGRHFIIRSIVASSIGEIIVTGVAYPLIFRSLGVDLFYLMLNAYLFKVSYSVVGAFPARIIVFFLRYIDNIGQDSFKKEFIIKSDR